ncbi:MAG: sugar phosphate nucleotidyltransferase [Candidatus Lokiarchaeota archaeon]
MKGIILAGGTGTRLSPLTKVTNKHLLPVYNEPMIYKVIKTLVESGIEDITIVLGGESVGDFVRLLGDGSEFKAHFSYVYQQQAGGIAEAIYLTKKINESNKVAVILGDNIFEDSFKKEISEFEESKEYQCNLFLKKVPDPERFGVAELHDDGSIISIEEKPEKPKTNYAVTGFYLYNEDIYDIIEYVIDEIGYSNRGELEITDVNNYFIHNYKTKPIFVKGFWSDAGTFETLMKSSSFIQSLQNERGYLQECFRSDWPAFKKFGQSYITVAFPGVVKAWHCHKIQTDNMVCILGNAKLVLFDDREKSKTKGKLNEIFFGEKSPLLVTIPPNIWHGFKAMAGRKIMVLNCPTELYNYGDPDEYRLPYDTNKIDYDWELKMG